jgi:hypothetical protein
MDLGGVSGFSGFSFGNGGAQSNGPFFLMDLDENMPSGQYFFDDDDPIVPPFKADPESSATGGSPKPSPATVVPLFPGSHMADEEIRGIYELNTQLVAMEKKGVFSAEYKEVFKSLFETHIGLGKKYPLNSNFHKRQLFKTLSSASKVGSAKASLWMGEFHRLAWFPVEKKEFETAGAFYKRAFDNGDSRGKVGMALCVKKIRPIESEVYQRADACIRQAISAGVLHSSGLIDLS